MVIHIILKIHSLLWNNLMCLDNFSIYILPLWVCSSNPSSECLVSNPDNENFDFIKILAQIRNNFSKFLRILNKQNII